MAAFLSKHPEFTPDPPEAPWFVPGPDGSVRLWPHKLLGEGHFAAVLRKSPDAEEQEAPDTWRGTALPEEWKNFAGEMNMELPQGKAALWGQRLLWLPEEAPSFAGLRVIRAGLELGELKKGRLEPAHALSHWLSGCGSCVDFPADSRELAAYLHGDAVACTCRGWQLVTVDGYGIGWGKGDGTWL